MPNSASDLVRKIELRLLTGDAGKAIDILRELADTDSLSASECVWAMENLAPYGDAERIEGLARRLVELDPDSEPARLRLADIHRESGRFEDAIAEYRSVLMRNPGSGRAMYYLASVGALHAGEIPAGPIDEPPSENGALIHFALGKLSEDAADYEQAMRHFDHANAIAARCIPTGWKRLDRDLVKATDTQLRARFTTTFVQKWRSTTVADVRPVFIVGLPRSGTTLLEWGLSNDPGVHAAGELPYWTKLSEELMARMHANPAGARRMAESYLSLLDTIAPAALKVIDKNPMNARLAGALHVLMPNARFVWCTRHGADNCLSMYKTFGGAPKDIAFSKRLLVDGYQLNSALKDHWSRVLPADRFMEITYEQLVTENDVTLRRVAEFCGIEWRGTGTGGSAERSVRTPSTWQVRQPVYTSSVDSWCKYEPWLGEFRELM